MDVETDETPLREVLLLEMHRLIADAGAQLLDLVRRKSVALDTTCYPPKPTLTNREVEALNSLSLSPEAQSGLAKLVVNETASAFFHFLCIVDGVGGPEATDAETWLGARIVPASQDAEDEPMWHDELFESYWSYIETHGLQ